MLHKLQFKFVVLTPNGLFIQDVNFDCLKRLDLHKEGMLQLIFKQMVQFVSRRQTDNTGTSQ